MECAVAGFQFHAGEACWERMKAQDRLVLRRDPGNRHDARAVRVEWEGVALGYVPRDANFAVSQMLDRGESVEARIAGLRKSQDPWKRVSIEVILPAERAGSEPRPTPPSAAPVTINFAIDPCLRMRHAPMLEFAPAGGVEDEWQKGILLVERVRDEIARRLALPATASIRSGRRSVALWDAIEISIRTDGHDLQVRFTDKATNSRPLLSLDLQSPLGAVAWTSAFVPLLWHACVGSVIHTSLLNGRTGKWIHRSLRLTFRSYVDFAALRRKVLEFLAPDALTHSLTNRIFGPGALAESFDWVGKRVPSLALVGVDRPALLPFLRFLPRDEKQIGDPIEALRALLNGADLQPAAWKRLEEWGYAPFDKFLDDNAAMPGALVEYANLLHRLDVKAAPPELFSSLASLAASFDASDISARSFESTPDWFMRALLREVELIEESENDRVTGELGDALRWLHGCRPEPDSNQRKAGWSWIVEQASTHAVKLEAGLWDVPCQALLRGPYRIVPIRSVAELREEAVAMKNCLADYEEECLAGNLIIFSIRHAGSGKRVACFAAERCGLAFLGRAWELGQVAGKMNSSVSAKILAVAEAVVLEVNR